MISYHHHAPLSVSPQPVNSDGLLALQGVKQLVSCLKQNSTLQKLDLENKVRPVTILQLSTGHANFVNLP